MQNHNSHQPPARWTEDRVERLLLSVFAEQPVTVADSSSSPKRGRRQRGLLIAVVASCLALTIPLLSLSVDHPAPTGHSIVAKWNGPELRAKEVSVDLALSDDVDLNADSTENSSATESDETAEAPSPSEAEDSAST
ncbi:MAG TPA: hypothetical protein VFG20_08505 [Planctomycetaceae bacterium]|nr:hypothetical protein [Planctomycetaceae bacterium]